MGQIDYDRLEAELEAERKLKAEVDQALRNVTAQMTGEVWADIVQILKSERDQMRELDHDFMESINRTLRMTEDKCLQVMDLAKAQDDEFWNELKQLQKLTYHADCKLFDSYIVHATTRIGLHMYYETLLAEYRERTEFLEEN